MSKRDGPFHPLRIEADPCDPAEAQAHMAAFVRDFIRPDARGRAEHILFRLGPKEPDRLSDLPELVDDRYTSPPRDLRLPAALPQAGVFFTGRAAWRLALADAEAVSGYLCRDGVWSGVAGSYAAVLHHEWSRWLCYRPAGERRAKPPNPQRAPERGGGK
jgi:hypothetical protein